MTQAQYEALMWEQECNRPLKLYALVDDSGAGGWVWVGPSGRWWIVPSGAYAALVAGEKLSQSRPIRAVKQDEFDFITKQLLGGLVPDAKAGYQPEAQLEHILSLDEATVAKLAEKIGDRPVVLAPAQLDALADAAAAAAATGGAAGARAAIEGLSFVVSSS